MKKILVGIIALALVATIGLSVHKVTNQAGDPPVGKSFKTALVSGGMHTLGDPPVG